MKHTFNAAPHLALKKCQGCLRRRAWFTFFNLAVTTITFVYVALRLFRITVALRANARTQPGSKESHFLGIFVVSMYVLLNIVLADSDKQQSIILGRICPNGGLSVLILSILLVAISRRLPVEVDYTHSAHSGAEGQTAMNLLFYTTGLWMGSVQPMTYALETRQDQLEQRTGQRAGVKNNSLRDQMRRDVLRRARGIYGPRLLVGIAVTVQLLSGRIISGWTLGNSNTIKYRPHTLIKCKTILDSGPRITGIKVGAAAFGSGRKSMRKLLEQRVTPTEMADQAGRNAARMQFGRNTSLEGGSAIGSIRW